MTTVRVFRGTGRWNRPLLFVCAVMVVLAAVAAVGIVVDPRTLTGAPIWLKPFKFAVSLGVYTATIAWTLSVLPRRSRLADRAAVVVTAMAAVEMICIVGQAIRGTTSHYNQTTTLNAIVWQAMGSAITLLFLAHLVIAVVVARTPLVDRVSAYAVRTGLALTLLGMLVAIPMTLPSAAPGIEGISGAHTVGLPDGGPGLPLVGWSTVGGDLRIGHFIGLHALQAMPLVGFLLSRYASGRLSGSTRARLVLVAAGGYGLLTISLTWQALRAQPLLRPDAWTLSGWGVVLVATIVAAVAVVGRERRLPIGTARVSGRAA